jgi:hypothetical protein
VGKAAVVLACTISGGLPVAFLARGGSAIERIVLVSQRGKPAKGEGKPLRVDGRWKPVTCIAAHIDGESVAVGHIDGDVRLLESRTLQGVRAFQLGAALDESRGMEGIPWHVLRSPVHAVVWLPAPHAAMAVALQSGVILLWGTASGALDAARMHRRPLLDLAALPAAPALLLVSADGLLERWGVTRRAGRSIFDGRQSALAPPEAAPPARALALHPAQALLCALPARPCTHLQLLELRDAAQPHAIFPLHATAPDGRGFWFVCRGRLAVFSADDGAASELGPLAGAVAAAQGEAAALLPASLAVAPHAGLVFVGLAAAQPHGARLLGDGAGPGARLLQAVPAWTGAGPGHAAQPIAARDAAEVAEGQYVLLSADGAWLRLCSDPVRAPGAEGEAWPGAGPAHGDARGWAERAHEWVAGRADSACPWVEVPGALQLGRIWASGDGILGHDHDRAALVAVPLERLRGGAGRAPVLRLRPRERVLGVAAAGARGGGGTGLATDQRVLLLDPGLRVCWSREEAGARGCAWVVPPRGAARTLVWATRAHLWAKTGGCGGGSGGGGAPSGEARAVATLGHPAAVPALALADRAVMLVESAGAPSSAVPGLLLCPAAIDEQEDPLTLAGAPPAVWRDAPLGDPREFEQRWLPPPTDSARLAAASPPASPRAAPHDAVPSPPGQPSPHSNPFESRRPLETLASDEGAGRGAESSDEDAWGDRGQDAKPTIKVVIREAQAPPDEAESAEALRAAAASLSGLGQPTAAGPGRGRSRRSVGVAAELANRVEHNTSLEAARPLDEIEPQPVDRTSHQSMRSPAGEGGTVHTGANAAEKVRADGQQGEDAEADPFAVASAGAQEGEDAEADPFAAFTAAGSAEGKAEDPFAAARAGGQEGEDAEADPFAAFTAAGSAEGKAEDPFAAARAGGQEGEERQADPLAAAHAQTREAEAVSSVTGPPAPARSPPRPRTPPHERTALARPSPHTSPTCRALGARSSSDPSAPGEGAKAGVGAGADTAAVSGGASAEIAAISGAEPAAGRDGETGYSSPTGDREGGGSAAEGCEGSDAPGGQDGVTWVAFGDDGFE